jgi:exonuclease III
MIMRFATWNVRNLLQADNMNVIAEEAESYKMDVVALQEIRLKGKGSIRKLKFTLHYSGNYVRQGNRGIGCIVSKKVSRSVAGFSPICDRICTLRIKCKLNNITFVNVYALTEGTEDETVDEFYETLQVVCDKMSKHDAIKTLGDFNVKIGKEQSYKDVIGRQSI